MKNFIANELPYNGKTKISANIIALVAGMIILLTVLLQNRININTISATIQNNNQTDAINMGEQLLSRLLVSINTDAKLLASFDAISNLIDFRAIEDKDGEFEELTRIELFFEEVNRLKNYYSRIELQASSGPVVTFINGQLQYQPEEFNYVQQLIALSKSIDRIKTHHNEASLYQLTNDNGTITLSLTLGVIDDNEVPFILILHRDVTDVLKDYFKLHGQQNIFISMQSYNQDFNVDSNLLLFDTTAIDTTPLQLNETMESLTFAPFNLVIKTRPDKSMILDSISEATHFMWITTLVSLGMITILLFFAYRHCSGLLLRKNHLVLMAAALHHSKTAIDIMTIGQTGVGRRV